MHETKAILVFWVLYAFDINAHPHNWIDLKTGFTLNNKGELTEVIQHWTFDIYYSAIKLADITSEHKDPKNSLKIMAGDMAKNLKNYQYFSELKIDGQLFSLPEPDYSSLIIEAKNKQKKLILTMNFALKKALPIKNKVFSWRVFDPTYYIDMKYHALSQISIKNQYQQKCSINIQSPKPSSELINYAATLDATKKNTQGLGAHFAETVLIYC